MRKITYLIILFLSLFLVSCKSVVDVEKIVITPKLIDHKIHELYDKNDVVVKEISKDIDLKSILEKHQGYYFKSSNEKVLTNDGKYIQTNPFNSTITLKLYDKDDNLVKKFSIKTIGYKQKLRDEVEKFSNKVIDKSIYTISSYNKYFNNFKSASDLILIPTTSLAVDNSIKELNLSYNNLKLRNTNPIVEITKDENIQITPLLDTYYKEDEITIFAKKIEDKYISSIKIGNIEYKNPRKPITYSINSNIKIEVVYKDQVYKGFYESLNGIDDQVEFFNKLRDLISVKQITYNDARIVLEKSDISTTNSNKLLGIYDGKLLNNKWDSGKTWNREHVWPRSRFGVYRESMDREIPSIYSDVHNLRAADIETNKNRSNYLFKNPQTPTSKNTVIGTSFYYPGDSQKGDVARILLYMVLRYKNLRLLDIHESTSNYSPEGNSFGTLSTLLKWHIDDPVDEFELNRNNVIYKYQKNRNPFIDYPNLFSPFHKTLMDKLKK